MKMMKHVRDSVNNRQEYVKLLDQMKFAAIYIRYRFRIRARRFGKDNDARVHMQMKQRFRLSCSLTHRLQKQRASQMIESILSEHSRINTFVGRLRDTFFHIRYIQTKFRNMQKIMQCRQVALRTTILFQETFQIIRSLQQGSLEKNKLLAAQISSLSELKKDFITECFIKLAKLDFREKFLSWYLRTKVGADEQEKR